MLQLYRFCRLPGVCRLSWLAGMLLLLAAPALAEEELSVTGVEASSDSGNEALNTLDGDLQTRWSAEGDEGDPRWIRYDLGQPGEVTRLSLAWHAGGEQSVRFDVQASIDGEQWTTVLHGQSSSTTDRPEAYELEEGQPARYLRIVERSPSSGRNNPPGLSEVKLFGAPAAPGSGSSAAERSMSGDPSTDGEQGDTTASTDGPSETPTLDVDGDGRAGAETDGLLIMRYLLDVRGSALTAGAVGQGASRAEAQQIVNYLDSARGTMLDVDGNGRADALTDGVLIQRYLDGYEGEKLTDGALGKDAARSGAEQISEALREYRRESTDEDETDTPLQRSGFLGMNPAPFRYYSSEWVFVDAMKRAMEWLPQRSGHSSPWDASGEPYNVELEFTENGWPILDEGEAAGTLIYRDIGDHYPAGTYTCTYKGTGHISFGFAAEVVERGDHQIKVRVEPASSGIYMRIDESAPEDPIRDVHLWLPGYGPGEEGHGRTFHPKFLERLEPFGVLRFMDWQGTNGSELVRWEDRTTPDRYSYAGRDMPLELMIQLCNELEADPWFCMPHKADDEFVRRFAETVRDQLHPEARIYVEYSNELWNSQFSQTRWINERAGGWGDPHIAEWADQAARDFAIWREVFGDRSDRIIRVAAGQAANDWVAQTLTRHLDGAYDAIAVAAYFQADGSTVDELVENASRRIEQDVSGWYRKHGELARQRTEELGRPISLITYEGGQHFTAEGESVSESHPLIAVQRDPRMYDLYIQNMLAFEKAGGSLFTAFNYVSDPNKWGSWGHLEYQDQPIDSAPKYRAVIEYPKSDERFQLSAHD